MKIKIILFILVSSIMLTSNRVNAGAAAGGSTEVTQILNNVELFNQTLEMYNQTANMIDRLETMVYNTEVLIEDPLAAFGVSDIIDRYHQVQDIINRAEGIAYSMENIDEVFAEKYQGYLSQKDIPIYAEEYALWHTTTMDTIQNTLKSTGIQMAKFESEEERLNEVLRIAQSANGRNALLQANNNINAVMMESLQDLKQLIALQNQQQSAYYVSQEQKQARENINSLDLHRTDVKPELNNIGDWR